MSSGYQFLDADEVAYLQREITLEEAQAACRDLGLSADGALEALRQRLCAHYEKGAPPAAAAAAAAAGGAALSWQGSAPPPPPDSRVMRESARLGGSTTTAPRAIVRCGWLEKKGGETYVDAVNVLHKKRHYSKGGRRNWKQRWFVLFSDGELHYYDHEPPPGEVLPPEKAWKGALPLVGVEQPFAGTPCCWHVRDSSPDELLLSLPSGSGSRRNVMLLRSEDEGERQGWIAATAQTFGSTVAPLLHSAEERGMAEKSVMAIRAKLAGGSSGQGEDSLDVAAKLPPTEAVVMFDFAAEEATDLALTRGAVVVLTKTEGEWWHGHIVGVPDVVGMFPATYVARGTAAPPQAAAASASASAEPEPELSHGSGGSGGSGAARPHQACSNRVGVMEARSRVALCIGIDAYGGRNTLPNCVNDATDMGTCAERMGFESVHVLRDAKKNEIMREVRRLRDERIKPGSVVLFYFSGHGQEHQGVTYLLPRGMESHAVDDLAEEAVSLDSVLKNLNARAEGTVNLLFLDCCRDNELDTTFKGPKGAGGGGGRSKGAIGKDVRAKKDAQYLIGLACDPGTVALADDRGRNSRYTAALLRHLPAPGQPLEVSMREVRTEVLAQTSQGQKPWENSCLTESIVLMPGESPEQRALRQQQQEVRRMEREAARKEQLQRQRSAALKAEAVRQRAACEAAERAATQQAGVADDAQAQLAEALARLAQLEEGIPPEPRQQQTPAQQRQQAAAEQRERERVARAEGTLPDGVKLFGAAWKNDSALANELLRQGAELEWRNPDGQTALAIACARGSHEAADELCAHGAELDTRDEAQQTPLICAAAFGYPKMCEMLLALGADPSLKSNSGKTALDWAREGNQPECAALLQPVTPGA